MELNALFAKDDIDSIHCFATLPGLAAKMTDCEIAHAVADAPECPFKTTGAVIESRHVDGWDRVNAHNPCVCVADGKVCLYYTLRVRVNDDGR